MNISKYKKRKEKKEEAKKILDQLREAEHTLINPMDKSEDMKKQAADKLVRESLLKLYKNAFMKKEEREKKDTEKKQEEEYYKAAEKYYKTPENLRGAVPKPPRANIVPFDPNTIIPEEDHKEEKQFKKITRKNVGKIDDDVKTDKKKLNTHVDPTHCSLIS